MSLDVLFLVLLMNELVIIAIFLVLFLLLLLDASFTVHTSQLDAGDALWILLVGAGSLLELVELSGMFGSFQVALRSSEIVCDLILFEVDLDGPVQ